VSKQTFTYLEGKYCFA